LPVQLKGPSVVLHLLSIAFKNWQQMAPRFLANLPANKRVFFQSAGAE